MEQKILRQGDLLLVRVDVAPIGFVRKPAPVGATIGYGEVSGHHHTIMDVEWLVAPDTSKEDLHQFALGNRQELPVFVVADAPTTLAHQEHAPIALDAGVWQVIRQCEYTPGAIMSVRD